MYRIVALAVAFFTSLHASAHAQNDILSTTYGKGVHSYFAGRYAEAHEYLTTVIDVGSNDPRSYYFRGLCYLKLGREPEAKADFARGAELEMADTTRFYNVSKALERCQGRARALLERYRADARVAAYRQRERIRYERYERIRRVEPDVTLQPVPGQGAAEDEENPAPGINDQPEAEEMPGEDDSTEEMPAEEEPAENEPAEDPAPETEEGAEEMPAEEMPAEEMPAEEDPFSQDQDSEDAHTEGAEAEDSAAEPPAAEAEDPSA